MLVARRRLDGFGDRLITIALFARLALAAATTGGIG
jgi:hypothetical protein